MSSNRETSSAASGGIGFAGLLTILFIGLKLTHYIDWGWAWVLSPLWISAAIGVSVFIMAMFFGLLVLIFKSIRR